MNLEIESGFPTEDPASKPASPDSRLKPISYYAQALKEDLPKDLFERNPARLVWYAFHLGVISLCVWALLSLQLIWPLKVCLSIVVGLGFGSLGFLVHEILHGSVVKSPRLQYVLAFFGLMPFFISPTFWRFWHNRLHHGKTQQLVNDPDAFPNLRLYQYSKFIKFMFPFTPGSRHKRSVSYFFFWFSFHTFVAQTYLRFRNSIYDGLNHRRVTLEVIAQITIFWTLIFLAGPQNIVWLWLIPLFAQNYFVMSYIATNHNLSPLTKINDPLANSMTVTNLPLLEWFHLNFGYHVEHHIYPTVSGSKIKAVHELLKKKFPKEFNYMPKWKAMKALYQTARIYKNANTLIHPETQETFKTIPQI